jgi:hypothetical protein
MGLNPKLGHRQYLNVETILEVLVKLRTVWYGHVIFMSDRVLFTAKVKIKK